MLIVILLCLVLPFTQANHNETGWVDLFNGKTLDGWEVVGEGTWAVLDEGILVGQCDPQKPCQHQAWLYTQKEFSQFDLRLEYWIRLGGNSGVSIRDVSRARYAVGKEFDPNRTPSRIAYEINLDNGPGSPDNISGGIYRLAEAKPGVQRRTEWNELEIECRRNRIRVKLNGTLVATHPGLPDRPKTGPIGLQLHGSDDVVMFRNIRLREVAD
jgi:3-keto-disaccharide hydrolase